MWFNHHQRVRLTSISLYLRNSERERERESRDFCEMSDRNESPFEIVSKEEVESSQQKDQERKGGGPVQVRRQNVDVFISQNFSQNFQFLIVYHTYIQC